MLTWIKKNEEQRHQLQTEIVAYKKISNSDIEFIWFITEDEDNDD